MPSCPTALIHNSWLSAMAPMANMASAPACGQPSCSHCGCGPLSAVWTKAATVLTKAAPVLALAATTLLAWSLSLQAQGLKVVGPVPGGLPPLALPPFDAAGLSALGPLASAALLISLVGFVESVSVGQTLAAKRRQRIEPDQELVALGASNLSAAFTGGFPVTGGFARSVVNFDAGAVTPAAGVYTAVGITLASLFLTPALYYLPQATLAATIVVAVLSLVDFGIFKSTWRFSKLDFIAVATTLLATLLVGVESGLVLGVLVSLALFLFRASRPHIATVGLVPGTEHFRNVTRHDVLVSPKLVCLRVDASMFFANARGVEDRINAEVAARPALEHVLLQCSAVNDIDASALESLEAIASRLKDSGIALHFSEIKGPVMDKLNTTEFLQHLHGRVFLTNYQAIQALTPEVVQ